MEVEAQECTIIVSFCFEGRPSSGKAYKATIPLAKESMANRRQSFQRMDFVGAVSSGTKIRTIRFRAVDPGTLAVKFASDCNIG